MLREIDCWQQSPLRSMPPAKEDSLHQYGSLYLHIQIKVCSNGKRALKQRNGQYTNHFLFVKLRFKARRTSSNSLLAVRGWTRLSNVRILDGTPSVQWCTRPLDRCDVYCHLSSDSKCMNCSTLSRETRAGFVCVFVCHCSGLFICVNSK